MPTRALALSAALLLLACSDDAATTTDGAETTGQSGTTTGPDTETGTTGDGDPGDGDGDAFPECGGDNPIDATNFEIVPWPAMPWTRSCTVVGIDEAGRNFTVDCPTQDLPEDRYILRTFVGAELGFGALPLSLDQVVTVAMLFEDLDVGTHFAWTVRDELGTLLAAYYFGRHAPTEDPDLDAATFAPLSFGVIEDLCPVLCEEPGLGVPPECWCREALALDVVAAPELGPIRISSGHAAAIADGYVAVELAERRTECGSEDRDQVSLLYVRQ